LDPLPAGETYPPITVTVIVPSTAASPQVSTATARGGGSPVASAIATTLIGPPHPAFFAGEVTLSADGSCYLQFGGNGGLFGYYNEAGLPWIHHVDLGDEYVLPSGDSRSGVYFWDMTTGHWWYTNPGTFPYLYDFTLHSWLYYFPDTHNAGHYTTNPRYFANMSTNQVFTM
jgi:hypothetical protein